MGQMDRLRFEDLNRRVGLKLAFAELDSVQLQSQLRDWAENVFDDEELGGEHCLKRLPEMVGWYTSVPHKLRPMAAHWLTAIDAVKGTGVEKLALAIVRNKARDDMMGTVADLKGASAVVIERWRVWYPVWIAGEVSILLQEWPELLKPAVGSQRTKKALERKFDALESKCESRASRQTLRTMYRLATYLDSAPRSVPYDVKALGRALSLGKTPLADKFVVASVDALVKHGGAKLVGAKSGGRTIVYKGV
jgi:hypothetical protein